MDPLTMAMMMKALAAGVQGVSAGATALQGVDRLSSGDKNRMKELERNQALGLLGLDEAQEQSILNQQLQPVQESLREALNRQQQRGLIEDVGQGATFRGEASLLEAQNKSKAAALETARDQITELDQLEKAAQERELAALKRRQVENRQRIASGLGQIGSSAITAYGDYQAAPDMAASIKAREAALLQNLAEETAEGGMKSKDQQELNEMLGVKDPLTFGSTLTDTKQQITPFDPEPQAPVKTETEVPAQAVQVGEQFIKSFVRDGNEQPYGYEFTGLDEKGRPNFVYLQLGSLAKGVKLTFADDKNEDRYQEALELYAKSLGMTKEEFLKSIKESE
tara:strand:+ start:4873 stop:5886 length:1014 start_codon:yes stop_codon:yes gene_type:complete